MSLSDLETELRQEHSAVFYTDIDLALAAEVTEAANRAEKLRRMLREKHQAAMERALFETARTE